MSPGVFLHGVPLTLDPARSLGKGGEADVYDLGNGSAAKVWKTPDHPDFEGRADDQKAAEARIRTHQTKMRAFPKGLPRELVTPSAWLTDQSGDAIVGYVMPIVKDAVPLHAYSDRTFRRRGVDSTTVISCFEKLAIALRGVHAAGVVIGDFNDFNVLVAEDGSPKIIDVDSAQFGGFLCTVFTERFVDPLLCDTNAAAPELVRPYTESADWYAYYALLFQSIFYVAPFGGVYRPKDPPRRVPHAARSMHHISIFHREVQVPRQTPPFGVLPEEWLHRFRNVFEGHDRSEVTPAMLRRLIFRTCQTCSLEYATPECPRCRSQRTLAVVAKEARRQVRVETLFVTRGIILDASRDSRGVRVAFHEEGAYRREDGTVLFRGALDPRLHVRVRGDETLVLRDRELVLMSKSGIRRRTVDRAGYNASCDVHGVDLFWVHEGRLVKATPSPLDPESETHVGNVLEGQTRLWIGPSFGIGFYRAGGIARGFVFDGSRGSLRDDLKLPRIQGEIVEAHASLDREYAWLFLALSEGTRIRHLCLVYSREGQCVASGEAERGDGSWLGTLGGSLATGGVLLVPTDAGFVRVSRAGGALEITREFPDTEPFVDASCRLLAGPSSVLVVHATKILSLHMMSD